jgi:hypothetical protein
VCVIKTAPGARTASYVDPNLANRAKQDQHV